jgi:hypothetical protein
MNHVKPRYNTSIEVERIFNPYMPNVQPSNLEKGAGIVNHGIAKSNNTSF